MLKDYLRDARAPRYSILYALPLLVTYEFCSFVLTGSTYAGVRNGADVLLKSAFLAFGGTRGLLVFDVLLLGLGAFLVIRDMKLHPGGLEGRVFWMMIAESVMYALLFGVVVGRLTALVLGAPQLFSMQVGALDLPTQLVTSLGAGIYEELLFRVVLTGGLLWLFKGLIGMKLGAAATLAVVLSALVFSSFHYIGSLGDTFTLQSFTFRAIAGLAFSALYVTRGLGVTAWTHALYDVLITLARL